MDRKTCTKCGEAKPLTNYHRDKGKPRANCKPCHRAAIYARRDADPEGFEAVQARFRERHRDELAERQRGYYAANRAKINANVRQRRAEDPARLTALARRAALRSPNEIPLCDADGALLAYTRVDPEDYERLEPHRWHRAKGGYAARNSSLKGGSARGLVLMHREVLRLSPKGATNLEVDHINRNRLDNRKENLRTVTSGEQRQNLSKRSGTTSRYRGVSWSKRANRWQAYYTLDGKMTHLGLFGDEEQAAEAARTARQLRMTHATD